MYTALIIISIVLSFLFIASLIIYFKQNTIKGKMLEKEAMKSGPDAIFALGLIYYEGINVKKDVNKAEEYIKQAAEMGSAQAQYIYASMLLSKSSPNISEEVLTQAFELILKSAEGGYVAALAMLGTLYSEGKLVQKDADKSINYFIRAAEKGDVFSQLTVAGVYHFSAEADKCVAYAWYADAATYGSPYAKNMADTIFAELNEEDKERATLLAEEYIKVFPPKCDTSNTIEKADTNQESLNVTSQQEGSIN